MDGVSLLQDNWRNRHVGLERALGFACLSKECVGIPRQDADWQPATFVGYSWFRDDQYAAPKAAPYLDAMMPRPFEIDWTVTDPLIEG